MRGIISGLKGDSAGFSPQLGLCEEGGEPPQEERLEKLDRSSGKDKRVA